MRHLGLDLLRLLAVLLVICHHARIPADSYASWLVWQRGSWVGVDLFFVLSGFLVSGLLFREHLESSRLRVGRFLVRRAFRIYPPFYAFLLFTLALASSRGFRPYPREIVGEALFLQNYVGSIWPHTWSLAVEEHFYFGLAAVLPLLLRWGHGTFSWVPWLSAAAGIACLGLRAEVATRIDYSPATHLVATHLRVDALLLGVCLSYLYHYRSLEERLARFPTAALGLAGGALLAIPFFIPVESVRSMASWGLCLVSAGAGCLLLAFLRFKSSSSTLARLGGAFGAASYSIYLWHVLVESWTATALARIAVRGSVSYEGYVVAYVAASLTFGFAMHKLIEWPTLRLRDRLFPRDAHPADRAQRRAA